MPRRKPQPKRQPGRPTLLTPELAERICRHIRLGATSLIAAAEAEGVAKATVMAWQQKARELAGPPYREFLDRVEAAFRARRHSDETVVGTAALKNPEWAWKRLERLDAKDYGRQVRVLVSEELDATLERLREHLSPAEYEHVLAAIASDSGRTEAGEAAGIERTLVNAATAVDAGPAAPVQPVGEASDAEV